MKSKALSVFKVEDHETVSAFVESELVNLQPSYGNEYVTLKTLPSTKTWSDKMVFWRDGNTYYLMNGTDEEVEVLQATEGKPTVEQAWEIFCAALQVIGAFPIV